MDKQGEKKDNTKFNDIITSITFITITTTTITSS